MRVLPSPYFYASFLPPPTTFWAVSPSSLNRSSPLLLVLIREYDMRDAEGFIKQRVAGFHNCQGQYHRAKELYDKALEIMIETGNRENKHYVTEA